MTRALSLLALAALGVQAKAFIVIDTFEQGYHLATITGRGNQVNVAIGLDRDKVFAGHRRTNYIANPEVGQEDYVSTFEVGLGEARVTTPGPRDMSTELYIEYGDHEPMNLDLSWFQGDGRLFEIDLETRPRDLFAQVWSIRLSDSLGRTQVNSRPGLRDGGIFFRKDGFVGNPAMDWSDIDYFSFRQDWNAQNTAPLTYWATEFRAVPEPTSLAALATAIGAAAIRRVRWSERRRPR
jgi:hypothetical protein